MCGYQGINGCKVAKLDDGGAFFAVKVENEVPRNTQGPKTETSTKTNKRRQRKMISLVEEVSSYPTLKKSLSPENDAAFRG